LIAGGCFVAVMVLSASFGLVIRGQPLMDGVTLVSLGLAFNGSVVDTQSTMFGSDRQYISHIFLAIRVLSVKKYTCEE
jgi:hypothetical protein